MCDRPAKPLSHGPLNDGPYYMKQRPAYLCEKKLQKKQQPCICAEGRVQSLFVRNTAHNDDIKGLQDHTR